MPTQQGFSVGRDLQLIVMSPAGPLTLTGTTDFAAKPVYGKLKHMGLDGIVRNDALPQGYNGTITLDRSGPSVDDFFAAFEAGYYAGASPPTGMIFETITEPDGSVSQYQYTSVVFIPTDIGNWRADQYVKQTIEFEASMRLQTA